MGEVGASRRGSGFELQAKTRAGAEPVRRVPPSRALQPFIEGYYVYQEFVTQAILPNGSVDLLFGLRATLPDGATLSYPSNTPHTSVDRTFWLPPLRAIDAFCIRFRPGGAYAFVGSSLEEFSCRATSAEYRTLVSRLSSAGCSDLQGEGVDRIDEALCEHLESSRRGSICRELPTALRESLDGTRRTSLRSVRRQLGLSERSFQRQMKEVVGLDAQSLRGLHRLMLALELRLTTRRPWAEIALEAGYSDQSHLARQARRWTALTPGRLERGIRAGLLMPRWPGWVPHGASKPVRCKRAAQGIWDGRSRRGRLEGREPG